MRGKETTSGSSPTPPVSSPLEVTEIQHELVKLNLQIKLVAEEFSGCGDQFQMEAVNGRARNLLDLFRRRLKRLETLAREQVRPEDCRMLLRDVESHRTQLTACQAQFRQANLRCIADLQRVDKEELLSLSSQETTIRQRGATGVVNADASQMIRDSGKLTDDLSAISRQLAATVRRSAATVDELVESSQTVSDTRDEFHSMGAVIGQSRKLINKYGRRETTDRVLIFFAFAFFFACVFYVLRKRVLGPLDPFSLAWQAVVTLINTVMALLGL